MTNREHVARSLTREVSRSERHNHVPADRLQIDDMVRVKEALLLLADSVDELERKARAQRIYSIP